MCRYSLDDGPHWKNAIAVANRFEREWKKLRTEMIKEQKGDAEQSFLDAQPVHDADEL